MSPGYPGCSLVDLRQKHIAQIDRALGGLVSRHPLQFCCTRTGTPKEVLRCGMRQRGGVPMPKDGRLWNRRPALGLSSRLARGSWTCAMPGDPREYRAQARRCAELASEAEDPQLEKTFSQLARSWSKLAVELEKAQVFRDDLPIHRKAS
jgi:hypothetical protein